MIKDRPVFLIPITKRECPAQVVLFAPKISVQMDSAQFFIKKIALYALQYFFYLPILRHPAHNRKHLRSQAHFCQPALPALYPFFLVIVIAVKETVSEPFALTD